MVKVERGCDRSFSPTSSLRNLGKGTTFHSLSRLDLDENASVSLSRYFNHGLLVSDRSKVEVGVVVDLDETVLSVFFEEGVQRLEHLVRVRIRCLGDVG